MSCSPPIIQEAYAINLLGHALWLGILLTWDVSRPEYLSNVTVV